MKTIKIEASFEVLYGIDELPNAAKSLMLQAIDARKKAYAPYSKFSVGAAILLNNNAVVVGSNQENAAYPSGLCAERVAIFAAGAQYPEASVQIICISATSQLQLNKQPIPPCGACRQSIAEYEHKQNQPIQIYFMGAEGQVYKADAIKDLLPLSFDKTFL